jgi:hypothetical protein
MYIPTWLIIIAAIVIFFIWKSKKKFERPASVEDIEKSVQFLKERIFELEHLDSPHFIDYQDAFDTMEINYLRLKQRFSHSSEKVLEIAKDWWKYVEALGDLKHARVMLDVDMDDNAWDNAGERMKEPSIIREEVENKFKSLLGKDFQEIPPDYFKRMDTMGKSDSAKKGLGDDWKFYYRDSGNLIKLMEKRKKSDAEWEAKKKEAKK